MSIVEILSRQYRWRRWSDVYPYLGDISGAKVVDLGCGIGDQARDLSRLGAHVFGVDGNQDAIDHAKSRGIARAQFVCCNITDIEDSELKSHGVWASFIAAYFPRFDVLTRSIDSLLKPGGWLAITEVNDLFGHEPLPLKYIVSILLKYSGEHPAISTTAGNGPLPFGFFRIAGMTRFSSALDIKFTFNCSTSLFPGVLVACCSLALISAKEKSG